MRSTVIGTGAALFSLIAGAAPEVEISVTGAPGSSADEFGEDMTRSTLFSPCIDTKTVFGGGNGPEVDNRFDQLSIRISGNNPDEDADGSSDYNLYVLLVNVSADGSADDDNHAQIFAFSRYASSIPGRGIPIRNAADLDPTSKSHMYRQSDDFSEPEIAVSLGDGEITFDMDEYSRPQGTWLALAILGTSGMDVLQPSTWAAWDVAPFVLGSPWPNAGQTCN